MVLMGAQSIEARQDLVRIRVMAITYLLGATPIPHGEMVSRRFYTAQSRVRFSVGKLRLYSIVVITVGC